VDRWPDLVVSQDRTSRAMASAASLVDRLWAQWQAAAGPAGMNPPLSGTDAVMDPWSTTVTDLLATPTTSGTSTSNSRPERRGISQLERDGLRNSFREVLQQIQ
jgi:hypothetical protein